MNAGDILVLGILGLTIGLIVGKLFRDRKKGGCCGGCTGCSMGSTCPGCQSREG